MKISFETTYCIDTSSLIDLKKKYPPDSFFKAIWDDIGEMVKEGNFFTIELVIEELNKFEDKNDFLVSWINHHKHKLILHITSEVWTAGKIIMKEHPELLKEEKQVKYIPEADPFLIATAMVNNLIIITEENKTSHNRIPAVSEFYGVRCINLLEFFEERGYKIIR
ncbi:MAG: DUF4411 family protein [Bacteroidetes bacterium]|nr:DUF4411 family protein [Bacteroidota bacterium]